MKAKDLLSQLFTMEQSLHEFSFEELSSKEANELKHTFETFKLKLENKIFQPAAPTSFNAENDFHEETKSSKTNTATGVDANMLIANVSHEIRTPLNGIIGFSDLLIEDKNLNVNQLERVLAIQKASYSLMEIINQLLEYSKLSSGSEKFEFIDFNFRNVLGDVMYLCQTLVSDKEVNLEISISDNVPIVLLGDPSKLTQILLNLIGNAIKFVEKGSIKLSVQSKRIDNNMAVIDFTIADTGIGISADNLKHIFDTFKQAEKTTHMKYGGSGLGLSIVKKIIENLGGNINVASELNVGTTFEFSIPYKIGDFDSLPKENSPEIEIQEDKTAQLKGMNILIFEDNLLNQRLIEQQLKVWECKTFITENAQYGLNILANNEIDLILMDLKMPDMNGFDMTKLIRNFEKTNTPSIPIIAISADFSVQDKKRCKACGINDFILKPYNSEELFQKLKANQSNQSNMYQNFSKSKKVNKGSNNEVKIDLSALLEDCLGQIDLLQELITLYKQNALEFIGNVHIHLKNNDIEQIGFSAHKIKSGLKTMHSETLVKIVEQIQKCCKNNQDIKELHFLYESFLIEYPKIERSLNMALEELIKSRE